MLKYGRPSIRVNSHLISLSEKEIIISTAMGGLELSTIFYEG